MKAKVKAKTPTNTKSRRRQQTETENEDKEKDKNGELRVAETPPGVRNSSSKSCEMDKEHPGGETEAGKGGTTEQDTKEIKASSRERDKGTRSQTVLTTTPTVEAPEKGSHRGKHRVAARTKSEDSKDMEAGPTLPRARARKSQASMNRRERRKKSNVSVQTAYAAQPPVNRAPRKKMSKSNNSVTNVILKNGRRKASNGGGTTVSRLDGPHAMAKSSNVSLVTPMSLSMNSVFSEAELRDHHEERNRMGDLDERVKNTVSMRDIIQKTQNMKDSHRSHREKRTVLLQVQNSRSVVDDLKQTGSAEKKKKRKFDADKFPYRKFLDKHYETIAPGIRKPTYTFSEYEQITSNAIDVFEAETTCIQVEPPVTIVGDIHGQFNDLINMFILHGLPPDRRYLFLGDYVDRGGMSVSVIMLLLAYKTYYPDQIFLLRGNHECPRVNKRYGFYNDCKKLPNGEVVWAMFQRVFNMMPVCAVVSGKILCMHGGLSPDIDTIEAIKKIKKPIRNPFRGVISDMLWADPSMYVEEWRNSKRGSGWLFGSKVLNDICERLGIELVVRAHQVCYDGFWCWGRRLMSLFSAPSYCNQYVNAGSILHVNEDLECQLICFVPDAKGNSRERIMKSGKVWDQECERTEPTAHA